MFMPGNGDDGVLSFCAALERAPPSPMAKRLPARLLFASDESEWTAPRGSIGLDLEHFADENANHRLVPLLVGTIWMVAVTAPLPYTLMRQEFV